jgi:hypothetical protein
VSLLLAVLFGVAGCPPAVVIIPEGPDDTPPSLHVSLEKPFSYFELEEEEGERLDLGDLGIDDEISFLATSTDPDSGVEMIFLEARLEICCGTWEYCTYPQYPKWADQSVALAGTYEPGMESPATRIARVQFTPRGLVDHCIGVSGYEPRWGNDPEFTVTARARNTKGEFVEKIFEKAFDFSVLFHDCFGPPAELASECAE